MSTRAWQPSAASLELLRAGVRQDRVATAFGVSNAAVSRWLAGHRQAPDELREILEQLAGMEAAERIMNAIPARPEAAVA